MGCWRRKPAGIAKPTSTPTLRGRRPRGGPFYHGTASAGFEAIDPEKLDPHALWGPGFYMTESPEVASGYALTQEPKLSSADLNAVAQEAYQRNLKASRGKGTAEEFQSLVEDRARRGVMKLHASIKKPLDLDKPLPPEIASAFSEKQQEWGIASLPKTGGTLYNRLVGVYGPEGATQRLRELGIDGFTHIGGSISGGKPHRVWIAFEPTQVKSATGNRGTFNPKDPRLAAAAALAASKLVGKKKEPEPPPKVGR